MKKSEYIAVETGNCGYVTIELSELERWIFQLTSDDLMQWDFTEEEHKKVKKLFLRKQLRKKYSPLVYDFAIAMLNAKANEEISFFEKYFF